MAQLDMIDFVVKKVEKKTISKAVNDGVVYKHIYSMTGACTETKDKFSITTTDNLQEMFKPGDQVSLVLTSPEPKNE